MYRMESPGQSRRAIGVVARQPVEAESHRRNSQLGRIDIGASFRRTMSHAAAPFSAVVCTQMLFRLPSCTRTKRTGVGSGSACRGCSREETPVPAEGDTSPFSPQINAAEARAALNRAAPTVKRVRWRNSITPSVLGSIRPRVRRGNRRLCVRLSERHPLPRLTSSFLQ